MAERLTPADLFVTTRKQPTAEEEADARGLAADFDLPFTPRDDLSITKLRQNIERPGALVVKESAIHLVLGDRRLSFHPNMATRRVAGGGAQGDHFLTIAGIGPGDHILDCTCGMGADAITAAHAVGPKGRVVALEAAPILASIVSRGLARYEASPQLMAAMRRIEHLQTEADTYLAAMPNNSFDVVALDPMFATPREGGHGLDLVRLFASDWVPTATTLDQARRVARRSVVMADSGPGPRLEALGIPVVSRDRRRWWGRIDATS
ncbi:class I SAM-dependent methyltransferase [Maritimibacter sp. UBA3975]|uniref:class I SAM-dependent methyltransferase n=1 Tax=Maritimibacter sp. UBA3975 TaxID=1946833 RepID=UPI000C0B28AE|nr:class I SAM-dependent methyltransferase [Maritimibacter sp. UBA3975]MAM60813.1 hypothetical protein [Maritimibacter sp.]